MQTRPLRLVTVLFAFACLVSAFGARADELDDILNESEKDTGGSLAGGLVMDDGAGGLDFRFRLVRHDDPDTPITPDELYWRAMPIYTAARTTPVRVQVDSADVIGPRDEPGEQPWLLTTVYPTEGTAKLRTGQHTLQPGKIPFRLKDGAVESDHPALRITKQADRVDIRCVAVRLDAINADGVPTPVRIELYSGKLLLLREIASFNPLVVWLPVGCTYESSFGAFRITPDGAIEGVRLGEGVAVTATGLRRTLPPPPPAPLEPFDGKVALKAFGTSDPPLALWTPPLAAPGGMVVLAVRRTDAEALIPGKGNPQSITGKPGPHLVRSPGPGGLFSVADVPAHTLDGAPSPAVAEAASQALGATPEALRWYGIPLPAGTYGTLDYRLQVGSLRGTLPIVVANTAGPLHLVPHRGRRTFARDETASLHALLSGAHAGGEARLMVRRRDGDEPVAMGTVALSAAPDGRRSGRTVRFDVGTLPTGAYELWLALDGTESGRLPITVVDTARRSPFLFHSMSCCTGLWPSDAEGMARLHAMGYEMLTSASGHGGSLSTALPIIDATTAARIRATGVDLPPEAAVGRRYNDYVFDHFLRAGMRHIDNTVLRSRGFYLESLSYHHSLKSDVDRMVRRMQVFTQQTAEYPAFWGTNFSWFPQLFGYVEGGVPTDGHRHLRNQALAETLREAGFTQDSVRLGEPVLHRGKVHPGLTRRKEHERFDEWKQSDDPGKRKQARAWLEEKIRYWAAQMEYGFGKHNRLYTDAIRQVRPGTVTTLFENAGHDGANKRTRDLFAGMDASCYESYTDYGVWPMSAAFTTDWARAERPGYPVWITVDWGLSSETQPKSLLHAFVRGLGGGGAPMQADQGWRTLQQRGRAVRFLQQVASIHRHATPDRRFGILTTLGQKVLDGRAYYTYHALYYHLTRLGAPPVLLPEERFQESGLPDDLRVLFIARQQAPFAPETEKMLAEFAARGGRIVATGDSDFVPEGATVLDPPLRNIWQLSGFRPDSHGDMWTQFLGTWRKPLTDALDAAGAPRFATTDPEQGLALGTTVGPIRYVAVIADPAGTHWAHFKPADALQISLEGTGWTVRNLATQETLDTTPADGRTGVTVPLVNEPATLLALLPSPPAAVTVRAKGTIVAGGRVAYTAAVTAEDGSDLGAAPMRFTLRDPAGAVRQTRYYAAGDELTYRLPVLDAAGAWTVDAQELLTGRTASLTVPVTATEPVAVEPVEPVHVVNAAHLRTFVRRAGPVWILLEPGQEARQAEADRLAEAVRARGREVRVWTVPPEAFAPHPLRWFPRAEDRARLERIERGELIGYRIDLTPYIDEEKAVHVPERGGYGAIDPPYMVGADCVLFSGGRLAESLRAVSPWLPTPSLPARGEARLLTLFSPFLADRHAVVIGAHDDDGYTRGAERLAAAFAHADGADTPADAIAGTEANPGEWTLAAKGEAEAAVPTPYRNYIPTRRIRRLLASPAGTAVFLTGKQDNLVFVGPDGAVTGSHRVPDDLHRDAHMDSTGRVWGVAGRITARHPGWHYPTAYELLLQGVGPDGLVGSLVAYAGDTSHLPPEHRQAFAVAPDGAHAALGRLSGFLTGPLADPAGWQRYDDLPHVRHRWEVRNPRWPVGVTWSPDSRYVLATLDTRPRMGGMGTPQFAPYACETVLVDTQTGRRLWGLRGEADNDGRYAFARPFGSVAANGVVAFADCAGRACIVAPDGRILLEEPIGVPVGHGDRLSSIKGGVGVVQSPDGRLAVFAMAGAVHLAAVTEQAATLHPVAIPNVHSVALLPDGPQVLVGTRGGVVVALDPDGRERWRTEPGGIDSVVAAAGSDRAVVATSDGVLVGLDAAGTETWRTDLAAVADAGTHALAKAEAFKPLPAPLDYRDPGTLALAKAHLGAERLAAWQPAGAGRPALGHTWHPFEGEARLDGNAKEAFLHLVYRRPEGNNALRVTTEGGDGKRTFELDLPTPTWRVVDLPVRGPDVRVTVTADGPVEIAALSLWSLRWPGANVAYVRPPDSGGAGAADLLGDDDDDMGIGDDLDIGIGELEGGGAALHGKMKDCLFYAWNPDPDQVSGPFLNVPAPPLKVVDGKRFQFGKLKWMTDAKDSYRGLWWTVAFPEPVKARFVAVYDLRAKQSETANNIGVFTEFAAEGPGYANTGRVLAGAVENDQFWRLFPLDGTPRDLLGVQVYRGDSVPEGLSEVEVY